MGGTIVCQEKRWDTEKERFGVVVKQPNGTKKHAGFVVGVAMHGGQVGLLTAQKMVVMKMLPASGNGATVVRMVMDPEITRPRLKAAYEDWWDEVARQETVIVEPAAPKEERCAMYWHEQEQAATDPETLAISMKQIQVDTHIWHDNARYNNSVIPVRSECAN